MAIKELLELVGSDVVIKQLDAVQKKGEESLAQFNKPLPELKFPDIGKIDAKPVADFTEHTVKLKDALHVLRPILQTAGLQIGEFGAFARLASGTLVGLGAALAGTIVVKLADLEETATKTKNSLSDLFGSAAAGETAFKGLEASARSLHTTTQELFPAVESLTRGLDKFAQANRGFKFVALKREDLPIGLSQGVEAVTKATENFFKILRAGGLDTAKATEAQKAFFETLRQGGTLTAEALNKLPVGTVELLAQALGKGALTAEQFIAEVTKAPINIDKVAKALAGFTEQSQKAFDDKAVRGFRDALADLLKGVEDQLKTATGKGFSEFLVGAIDEISKGIQTSIKEIERIIELWKATFNLVKAPPIPGISAPAGEPTQDQKDLINQFAKTGKDVADAFKRGTDQIQRDSAQAATKVASDWDAFGQRFKTMIDEVVAASKLWTDEINKSAPKFKFVTPPGPGEDPFAGQRGGISPTTGTTTAGAILGATFTGAPKIDTVGAATFTGNVTLASIGGFGGGGGDRIAPPPEFRRASFGGEGDSGGLPTIDTSSLIGPFQDAVTRIGQMWQGLMDFISTSASAIDVSGVSAALVAPFEAAIPQIQSLIQQAVQSVQELNQSIQQAVQGAGQLSGFASGGGIGHAATGGMVRGGGTTTSDSILAWLSNREFVVNAKAVSHYGPDFFAALNAMRLPLNFNMGGMARMMSGNKFAGGGMAKGNPVILNIDRKSFNMTAGDDTIAQLKRFAVTAQISSTGRKPRWVK